MKLSRTRLRKGKSAVNHRINRAAAEDLTRIVNFGYDNWGRRRTDDYLASLERALEQISERPFMFPAIDDVMPGLRRRVWGAHTVFFEVVDEGVIIVRILGRQDPANLIFED